VPRDKIGLKSFLQAQIPGRSDVGGQAPARHLMAIVSLTSRVVQSSGAKSSSLGARPVENSSLHCKPELSMTFPNACAKKTCRSSKSRSRSMCRININTRPPKSPIHPALGDFHLFTHAGHQYLG
jgi:hypothetical protein